MRLLLIVNTSASSVTARGRVVIHKALAADHDVTMAETSRRGHATRLAQGAAANGMDAVVVLGGDGTLNEAANGLAGSATALGVLPGGSTNVFARTIGLINDPIEATGQLLGGLATPTIRRIGLGSINGRYFLFHVGVGFDAAVVAQVERHSGLKRWAGHPLFVYAGFDTWFRHYDRTTPGFSVEFADGSKIADGYLAICLNTNPYTFLGNRPLNLGLGTGFDTALTLTTFRSLDFGTVLGVVAAAAWRPRRLERFKHVHRRRDLDKFVLRGLRPVPYQVDGDHLGDAETFVFRYEREVLNLVVPTA